MNTTSNSTWGKLRPGHKRNRFAAVELRKAAKSAQFVDEDMLNRARDVGDCGTHLVSKGDVSLPITCSHSKGASWLCNSCFNRECRKLAGKIRSKTRRILRTHGTVDLTFYHCTFSGAIGDLDETLSVVLGPRARKRRKRPGLIAKLLCKKYGVLGSAWAVHLILDGEGWHVHVHALVVTSRRDKGFSKRIIRKWRSLKGKRVTASAADDAIKPLYCYDNNANPTTSAVMRDAGAVSNYIAEDTRHHRIARNSVNTNERWHASRSLGGRRTYG